MENTINEIQTLKLSTGEVRKVILLYLHNDFHSFSIEFCNLLTTKEWADIPIQRYYLIGWDITDNKISNSLKSVTKRIFGYNVIYEKLMRQTSTVFVIKSSVVIAEYVDNSTSLKHFPFNIKHRLKALDSLPALAEEIDGSEEICAQRFQQLMYEHLGDRDFDSFEFDEHKHLRQKIYYAIYGMPDSVEEDEKKTRVVKDIYKQIRSTNNEYCKWDDKIVISFIYNCTETALDTTGSMYPLPIFIVRKCKGNNNPCRLFIDLDLRVYSSWKNYLLKNKLPRCNMIVPKDGHYQGDSSGNVLLETYKSPQCSKKAKIIKYFDIIVTILALISAFTMVASFIYPVLALPSGIVGILCAIYSITRSSIQIHDRKIHKLDMNFKNADARGAYLTILGNSVGIVGGALTRTVAMIATNGIRIGKTVITVVNAFNYAGLTTDFAGILNAIYAMKGSSRPDSLQILQFAFSILFFNNSVVNLVRTRGQFIQSEISQSMKTNLMNKRVHKTTGQTVTHLRSIHTNDVMKTLNNINTNTAICKSIKFSNQNGRVMMNNVSVSIMRQTVVKFQGMYLPPSQYVTQMIQAKFLTNEENVELYIDMLHRFPEQIKNIIIDLAKKLIHFLKEEHLNFNDPIKKIFPHSTNAAKILEIIVLYFEDKYNVEHKATDTNDNKNENMFLMIENCYLSNSSLLMDLTQFYLDWLTTAIYEYERALINREKRRQAQKHSKIKVYCKKCGGHYYKHSKKNDNVMLI
ncbi:hypothetical protein MML48_2g00000930 [Holotrichia oblita]|uniref:Uncharacterized protein n=1 Tax=Holotrichia oblita TaxID=644536 RepID=A0ACB9TLF9_HOLOL|nr:hypothetical protein MML48_2g00000930 [Holotrichia oblita]